jgi:putative salt-induced outer membrane protein YdiY
MRKTTTLLFIAIALLLNVPALCAEAEEEAKNWSDTAEFSFVATDGNSESMSLGFKNTAIREWEKASLTIRAGGIRVETTTFTRTAVDGVVTEDKDSETTAENYYLNGRYDRQVHDRLFWYAGAGWDRNEFAGIKNRYVVESGVGNVWRDTDDLKFKTTYGLTFTDQEDVVENPTVDETFLGARVSWDYMNKLGANTTFTNVLVLDENLDETSDWRADMLNGLAVAMNDHLALKLGLRLLYDNEPSLELVPNVDGTGAPLAPVPYELEELDTILTISLVADF